jgi:glycosyl transferase family 25
MPLHKELKKRAAATRNTVMNFRLSREFSAGGGLTQPAREERDEEMTISAYIINLPERIDRRAEMQKQLQRVGWAAEFKAAVRPRSADGFSSIGAHGCFLSHLTTLERAKHLGSHVIIMEDDLNFIQHFNQIWQKAYEELVNKDWSIFYAAHVLTDKGDGLKLILPDEGVICAHFVMFHHDAVAKIIDELQKILSRPPGHPLGGPMHVDGAYSTIRAQNAKLITYAHFPPLGYQRSSRSDIADPMLIDRIRILSPIVSRLRGLKQKLKR